MKALDELTDEEYEKLNRCIRGNKYRGCRSADGECGPFDIYGTRPCFEEVGISLEAFWEYSGYLKEADKLTNEA